MNRLFRAAQSAAALSILLFGTFHAGPSSAWELNETPVSAAVFSDMPESRPAPAPATGATPPAAASPGALREPEARREPRSLAALVAERAGTATDGAQHECLAGAVYFEAKGEPLSGQLSVAEVIINRARSGRFPASLCGVVKQRGQFSFVRSGRFPAIARSSAAWQTAVGVARVALQDLADGPAPKALFFHARRVAPGWKLTRVATVGNHIFYR
ncbi:MAG TPA: cell wall hydrolase [Allosphingosinicella sp.]|nr:cell wall hydrolase [Allosphingosinicella sp.]